MEVLLVPIGGQSRGLVAEDEAGERLARRRRPLLVDRDDRVAIVPEALPLEIDAFERLARERRGARRVDDHRQLDLARQRRAAPSRATTAPMRGAWTSSRIGQNRTAIEARKPAGAMSVWRSTTWYSALKHHGRHEPDGEARGHDVHLRRRSGGCVVLVADRPAPGASTAPAPVARRSPTGVRSPIPPRTPASPMISSGR